MHLRGAHHLAAVSVLGLLCLLLGFPVSALASGGQLDGSFGGDGKVTTHFAGRSNDTASAVAIQTDGKIVAAGDSFIPDVSAQFALARYKLDGTLDPSFGEDGKVKTTFAGGSDAGARAVAIQADGKIVAAGYTLVGDARFALARYNIDGSLDSSFGGDGKVITRFAEGSSDSAGAVAIQADGQIVVAGSSHIPGVSTPRFALARYNPDGDLDPSFGGGGDGKVTTQFAEERNDYASAVAIQADGQIVAAGGSFGVFSGDSLFALARYNPNGDLDDSFGGDGKVTSQFAGDASAWAVAIQDDSKIVAAGDSQVSHRRFALARYNPNGDLDPSFGPDGNGKVRTRFSKGSGDSVQAVAIQADGQIVAAGYSKGASHVRFALARYDTDGMLDPSFGGDGDGKVRTHFAEGTDDAAFAVAIQANGRIVAAGYSRGASYRRFALTRYMAA
jgi:uncharacterized delta-60 repeat protein